MARNLRAPANRITRIINGRQSITADTALRLAHWFGTSAQYWLDLQRNYDLAMAKRGLGRVVRIYRATGRREPLAQKPAPVPSHGSRPVTFQIGEGGTAGTIR